MNARCMSGIVSMRASLMAAIVAGCLGIHGTQHSFASERGVCIRNCGVELFRCIEGVRARMSDCAEPRQRSCDHLPEGQRLSCKREARIEYEVQYASEYYGECMSDHRSCVVRCE